MAYGNQSQGSRYNNNSKQASPRPVEKAPVKLALRTGLFKPKSEKSKAIAGVVTEIGADLKAGQKIYVDLYKNSEEDIKAGKPPYVITVKEAANMG